jgi:hypothetical protein
MEYCTTIKIIRLTNNSQPMVIILRKNQNIKLCVSRSRLYKNRHTHKKHYKEEVVLEFCYPLKNKTLPFKNKGGRRCSINHINK